MVYKKTKQTELIADNTRAVSAPVTKPSSNLELQNLFAQKGLQPSLEETIITNERALGLRAAFETIKNDTKTHQMLRNYCGEAEGFVLNFQYGTYVDPNYVEGCGAPCPPYLSIDCNLTWPADRDIMLVFKPKECYLAIGEMREYNTREGRYGKESIVKVNVPNDNDRKLMTEAGAALLHNPEHFALYLIYTKATTALSLSQHQKQKLDATSDSNRVWNWDQRPPYAGRYDYKSRTIGDDLLLVYKKAIRDAVRWQDTLNHAQAWENCSLGNIRFFNKNYYPTRRIATKLSGIDFEPLFF